MNIHLAALPGQFHVTPDVDHPGNPFGVTFHPGTPIVQLSLWFLSPDFIPCE